MLRIRDVYPRSWIPDPNFYIPDPVSKWFRIPDPDQHQGIKVFLTLNTVSKALGKIIWDVHPGSRIQGSKKHRVPDPEHYKTQVKKHVKMCSSRNKEQVPVPGCSLRSTECYRYRLCRQASHPSAAEWAAAAAVPDTAVSVTVRLSAYRAASWPAGVGARRYTAATAAESGNLGADVWHPRCCCCCCCVGRRR